MADDYYKTLGLGRTASDSEIRKAYRELARKYHPDHNQDDPSAKQRFQEVQTAFDTLNDSKKREMYDRYGSAYDQMGGGPGGGPGPGSGPFGGGFNGGAGGANVNFEDLFGAGAAGGGGAGGFADLFKQFGGGGRSRPGRQQRTNVRGADIEHELTVPFATAVTGGEAQISVRRADGPTTDKLGETIQVKIPAGIEHGKKIRLRGQGDPGIAGGTNGDILIKVNVAPHPVFRRSGKRLEVRVPITLAEAVAGGKIDVPSPHGTLTLTVPPGSSSGQKLRAKGQGVQPTNGDPGDLYAELQIVLPEDISEEDRKTVAEVLGKYDQSPRDELKW
ncbi:DnaJ C-terminal domain-containing protein [Adhaeretor mobilis]|uniref:Curved DNA-binding protein n=1 Tax=Adhaeretor mobilis TaxID=1930276 RepID=A0A517MSC4_9BACT|nr:J domain-containing protein [Adhaeretor mobilis]QDS97782.1 Curved DNA-binding protein [Adhaeretor mobilis]